MDSANRRLLAGRAREGAAPRAARCGGEAAGARGRGLRLAQLLEPRADAPLARRQLAVEALELGAAVAHELELVGDVHEGLLEDAALLRRLLGVLPFLAEARARALRLRQPLQVVE